MIKHLLLTALLFSLGFAQTTQNHQLQVRIPNYIGLKIVDAAGNINVYPSASVIFDYASDPATYYAATIGSQTLPPTQVNNFTDVQVAVRGGSSWSIQVRGTSLIFTGTGAASGFLLGDIRVIRGAVSGLSADPSLLRGPIRLTNWSLTTSFQTIFRSNGATLGWDSLGFNGQDYQIRVQGNEQPGQYATVVTYRLTFP